MGHTCMQEQRKRFCENLNWGGGVSGRSDSNGSCICNTISY